MVNGEIHAALGDSFPANQTIIQLVSKDGDCYINSVLQSLYNLRPVQDYIWNCQNVFEREQLIWRAEESPFGFFVRIYVDSIRASANEVLYEPNYFLDRVFGQSSFRRGVPSDAHQFFLYLLHCLDREESAISAERQRRVFQSFKELFYFTSERNGTEPNGECWSVEDEFFSLSLPPAASISEGLAKWADSVMDDGTRSVCTIVRLPQVLVCNSCAMNMDCNGYLHKRFSPIQLQERLSLRDREGEKEYELMSVVIHNGADLDNGHYICVIKTCGRWVLADDAYFRGLGDEEVSRFLWTSYIEGYDKQALSIAFYQRC
jgi:ubiquitin C-terminal hydrolase